MSPEFRILFGLIIYITVIALVTTEYRRKALDDIWSIYFMVVSVLAYIYVMVSLLMLGEYFLASIFSFFVAACSLNVAKYSKMDKTTQPKSDDAQASA